MTDVFTLCIAVALSASASLCNAFYGKKGRGNPFLFVACSSFTACLFFLCYNRFRFRVDRYTLTLSLCFAIAYLTCMLSEVMALKRGSVAMTSLISSFSLLLPTLFGIVYWKEPTKLTFYIGLLLVCVAIVLSNWKKEEKGESEQPDKPKIDVFWVLFVGLIFFANGTCSILQTYHQKTGGAPFKAEFMIFALTIVFVSNATLALVVLKKKAGGYLPRAALLGGGYGLCNGGLNLAVMLLASGGVIHQSVFFPVISVGGLALVFLSSIFIFKEKFWRMQYLGVALGVLAIVLLR